MDAEPFQTLLGQVQEMHGKTDELTRSKARVHENVRARLAGRTAPVLPDDQRKLADEVVNALNAPRLSSSQARRLHRTYFGR